VSTPLREFFHKHFMSEMQMKNLLFIPLAALCLAVLTHDVLESQSQSSDSRMEFEDIQYPFLTSTALVNGISINYYDSKRKGPTLVLIHGLASHIGYWRDNIPDLTKAGLRVIALDLPGYGKSDKPDTTRYSLRYYAQTVVDLLKHLNIPKATFVGLSMGGQIALTAALNHAAYVEKVVLLSTAGFEVFTEAEGGMLKAIMTPEAIDKTPEPMIRTNFGLNFYEWKSSYEWMVRERLALRGSRDFKAYTKAVSHGVSAMLDEPVFERLKDVSTNTLVIAGENDKLIPNTFLHKTTTREVMESGTKQIRHARLMMLPNAGHLIQIEKSNEVNQAIIEFCK
jgi:pimeloyl-ACP methyl ester carboxylesterase